MTRNHAFDIILKFLYDNNGHYWNMIQTCKEKLNITDGGMISSICKEMICNEWVTPKNQDKMSVAINYEGRMMIEKYGSYSSFLQFEKKTKKVR